MRDSLSALAVLLLAIGCSSEVRPPPDDDDPTTPADDDDSTSGPEDVDGDGWSVSMGDCDDANPAVYPGATEVCNRVDDDCDGELDEGEWVDPLPPGVYGLAAAHARLVGDAGLLGMGTYSAGDTSGDGRDDLLITCLNNERPGICVVRAPFCDGPLIPPDGFIETLVGGAPGAAGDINGDGLGDAFLNHRIYLGPLEGEVESSFSLGGFASSLATGDLNGDGAADLVVGDTTTASVRFHAGPFSGDAGPAVTIEGESFGERVVVLPGLKPPVTLVGAATYVGLIEGLPTEGAQGPDRILDLAPLFPPGATNIGTGLVSDGHDRFCVGTDIYQPTRVICGTVAEIDAGTPELIFDPRAGNGGAGVGPDISMTKDLVAVGHLSAVVGNNEAAGVVYVRGTAGEWVFEWDGEKNLLGFGRGVALLRDPAQNVTWLAAASPTEGEGGVVYLFALDAPPPM